MIRFCKYIFLSFLILLSACATRNPLTEFHFQTLTTPPYILATWYRIDAPTQPIHVYIEGDGNSFNAYNLPTDNPTPTGTFLRDIAANDPYPNVIYLARPCQYLQTSTCAVTDWTDGRFSEQIVHAMTQALQAYLKKAQTDKAVLIGYSGGAQIAGLVAVRKKQYIQKVITIAGVLDHKAWSEYHHDSPLLRSINLKDYKKDFQSIPQIHFVGTKDSVVPNHLTKDFIQDPDKIIFVNGADHQKGFDRKAIYEQE